MARIVEPDLEFVKGVIEAGGDTLKKCYQCATCAVVCPLSTDENPFPRKQMILAQWGMKDQIARDPALWLCHQCSDCTAYCPRGARPGDVLAAIRSMTIREYAEPKFLWSLYNSPGGLIVLFGAALLAIFVAILLANHGLPDLHGPVRFSHGLLHGFLPVLYVDLVFLPLAGFVALIAARGALKMWSDLTAGANIPVAYRPSAVEMVTRYIIPAVKEILTHERFKKCGANYERYNGHRLVLYAFIVLFIVTMIVFFCADIIGSGLGIESFHTPWPLWNPVKILGIFGGIILIYGSILLIQNRKAREAEGKMSGSYADWFLLYLVLFVGLTGLGALALRIMGFKIAYLMYVLHLACVFVLFLGLPFSKFAHLVYRTTVMVYDRYVTDVRERMAAAAAPAATAVEGGAPATEEVAEAKEEGQESRQD